VSAASAPAVNHALRFDGVRVAYHLESWPYTAVERAELSVGDGEFVAIVGPTGCGKTTLLNIAAGLVRPTAGRIAVFGAPLSGANRQAGYLFQA
jgi:NitT/TauT family transport system ATP-binding protein